MNEDNGRREPGTKPADGSSSLAVEILEGGIMVITLNRPESRNSINRAVGLGIATALERLDHDALLHVGVLTGAGKGFSSGADLRSLVAGEDLWIGDRGFAGIAEQSARKPLIVAIEGFALAGGLEVALACDILVASRGALLGLPEPKRGLVATGGGVLRLGSRLAHNVAMEIALTGEPITAERAYELGLVNRLTEPGAALDVALDIARTIGRNAPLAVTATKAIIDGAPHWSADVAFARQAELATAANGSEDAAEGALAFVEKRPAVWRGQ